MTDERLLGKHQWKGKLDLLNIVLIGLPKKLPEQDDRYELHRLLTALFLTDLSVNEKLNIVKEEYHIRTEKSFGKEMSIMCNLSQGVLEKGIEQGIEQGIEIMIGNMYREGISLDVIAQVAKMTVSQVQKILKIDR